MPSQIRIYFEGDKSLRPGFQVFFAELINRARLRGLPVSLIASRSTAHACRDFGIALKTHADTWNILLIDSDEPFAESRLVALCNQHNWEHSHADSIFLMVEMMESWFHADKDALARFYGHGFKRGALKPNPNVEDISKADLKSGLQSATRNTKPGDYFDNKTSHGPKILEKLDPALVRAAAPNCKKLFDTVLKELG